MFQGKKLVCFDLDGTLIDSVGIWNQVDAALIQELSGIEVDLNQIQQQRDLQLTAVRHLPDPYLEYCGYLKAQYGFELPKEEVKNRRYSISRHFLDHVVELKPQADLLIQTLKQQDIQMALTTTTSLFNVQRYLDNNQNINQKINFQDDFALLLTRENVQNIKPHPEVYLNVLKHFDVEAQDCLIVEDSLIGVEAANNAGIEVVAVYDQYSEHEMDLIKDKADYFVQNFTELLMHVAESIA
ncbi:haloacid dehalogenase [Acinetobacter sp. LoGeW2-3]|uniref:HAD family hydrolase n=1 Tax=Acinetobacter sp. LoGeW2-3 TaxID=1808001 RepID=UPI000C05B983|nr:HAD family phosphatase [Acinetobacter sp. LoGeW2-3]ATO20459.1 haloacid dehalogenase [Acinetobacter sp. LoGeW2-3]